MKTAQVPSPNRLAFERGRRAYRNGKPCPHRPWDKLNVDGIEFSEVLGWKWEQFGEDISRRRTMEALGVEWDGALPRKEEG